MATALRDEKGRFVSTGKVGGAGATFRWEFHGRKIQQAVDRGTYRSMSHAAASLAKAEKLSIEKSTEASEPGSPPHTRGRGGHNIKGAIRYAADKESAVIGPVASVIGTAGEAHEFGGEYRGQIYPKREFARPALEKNIDRFAGEFRGSIGQ